MKEFILSIRELIFWKEIVLDSRYDKRKFVDIIILTFGSFLLLGISILLGLIIFSNYEFVYSYSILICVGVFPYCYIDKCYPKWNEEIISNMKWSVKLVCVMLLVLFFINLYFGHKNTIMMLLLGIKYLIVSFSEELLFRCYIQKILETQFKKITATIVQSLLFAFLFHSGLPLILNLLVRFPAGGLLSIIYKKTKNINYPISIHFMYDMIINIIWL